MRKPERVFNTDTIKPFFGAVLVFGMAVGFQTGILNNYLYEVLAIGRVERGIIEFPRELPGLLLLVIVGFLYRFSEAKLVKVAFMVSLVGYIGLIFWGDLRLIAVVMIVLWSTGEHLMMPLRQSVSMHSALPGKEGAAMGRTASMGNIGEVIGRFSIPLLFIIFPFFIPKQTDFTYFRIIFVITGVALMAGLFLSTKLIDTNQHVKRKRLLLKRKYKKYYILEAFFGARKQIFLTFAPYVLIINYGAKTELIATLYGIWSVSNIFINPLIGKVVDKIGFKKVIIFDTVILIAVCLVYGFAHKLFPLSVAFIIICIVFVLDAMLFALGMARAMYAKTLSDSNDEVTSTLSTGISINHLVSIIIAVLGGFLWEILGTEVLFSLAAVFAFGSFLFSLTLPKHEGFSIKEQLQKESSPLERP